jgi:hypothetical protein
MISQVLACNVFSCFEIVVNHSPAQLVQGPQAFQRLEGHSQVLFEFAFPLSLSLRPYFLDAAAVY